MPRKSVPDRLPDWRAIYFPRAAHRYCSNSLHAAANIPSMPIASCSLDPNFQATFGYSIPFRPVDHHLHGVFIVPTAYCAFSCACRNCPDGIYHAVAASHSAIIVNVFGYLRIYNSSSWLPFTASTPSDRPPDKLAI